MTFEKKLNAISRVIIGTDIILNEFFKYAPQYIFDLKLWSRTRTVVYWLDTPII